MSDNRSTLFPEGRDYLHSIIFRQMGKVKGKLKVPHSQVRKVAVRFSTGVFHTAGIAIHAMMGMQALRNLVNVFEWGEEGQHA